MACSILEIAYSKFISDADGNLIRAVLLCDTAAELPGINDFSGYTLIQGSTCHVIADNQDYMLDSVGTWHAYGGEIWNNVYTKTETDTLLNGKQDTLDAAQLAAVNSGITAEKLTADEAALVKLVNSGAKNVANWSAATQTINNVIFTISGDTVDVTLASGTTATARSQKALDLIDFDTLPAGKYIISGAPTMSSGGLYVWDGTAAERVSQSARTEGGGVEFDFSPVVGHSYNITVDIPNGFTVGSGLVFRPMICTLADWNVSQKFVPYCPSMQEMYQMILALQ